MARRIKKKDPDNKGPLPELVFKIHAMWYFQDEAPTLECWSRYLWNSDHIALAPTSLRLKNPRNIADKAALDRALVSATSDHKDR